MNGSMDFILRHQQMLPLYRLYIDESGDLGNYFDENNQVIEGSSRFFTLAGIIVSSDEGVRLGEAVRFTIGKYFNNIQLPKKFRLHYRPLRNRRDPYDKLSDMQRKMLADDVFDMIRKSSCSLLSVTIDLKRHSTKYSIPADPQSYAMLIMQERFHDFLEENGEIGEIIYEKLNRDARKKIGRAIRLARGPEIQALQEIGQCKRPDHKR